jgi:transposase
MNRYKEMVKLAVRGKASCNAIAEARGFSHHTVRRWRDIAISLGLTPDAIDALTDSELNRLFKPRQAVNRKITPDFAAVDLNLARGYNIDECHQLYTESVGVSEAYAYSTFCQLVRLHQGKKDVIFRHHHIAGHTVQVDFAGYTPLGLDGEIERKYQVFVAALPASHYCFAICIRSQSTIDFIEAYIATLEFYGGAPDILVSDNLKAMVTGRSHDGTPKLNAMTMCAADYYNMQLKPTRVRRPQDKAAVEVAVKLIQRHLSFQLSRQPLLQLADINRVLAEVIDKFNKKKMRRGNESRLERFERLDQPALQTLPLERLQFLELPVERRVQTDHHVSFDSAYYSVPHELVGKLTSVRGSSKLVEIRFDGHVVAMHPRAYETAKYVTLDQHRPANHIAWMDQDFDDWRSRLNEDVRQLVDLTLARVPKEKRERLRVIERVRRIARQYGIERFHRAVNIALGQDALSFKHVTNMLRNEVDLLDPSPPESKTPIKAKTNVRGAAYFARDLATSGGAA